MFPIKNDILNRKNLNVKYKIGLKFWKGSIADRDKICSELMDSKYKILTFGIY